MQKFKQRWEIQQNWQLIFPVLGISVLVYSSYKLALVFIKESNIYITIFSTIILSFLLLKFILFLFLKLEKKWVLTYKWEMIRVFIVFSITGTASIFVGRPIIRLIGITKENLNPVIYWILYIIIGLIFYQILLVCIGWLFGQFQFFWNFEKKMLRRFGLKRFVN
ncbi:hypothetical protein EB822_07675 [Flavobacteriaceae bacterium PRS1]|jgi:hypothetical protein|nr:hypothetical protein EB822_07675 [Flavobacteriaceae bacterium PRS1]